MSKIFVRVQNTPKIVILMGQPLEHPQNRFFGRKTKIGQKQGFEAIFTLKSLKEIRQKMAFFSGLTWATVWPQRTRYCQECFFKLPKVASCG